jgi:hypothetical protein
MRAREGVAMAESKGPGRFQIKDLVYWMLSQLPEPDKSTIEAALASSERLEELFRGGSIPDEKDQYRVATATPTFRLVFRKTGGAVLVVDLLHRGVFESMGVALHPVNSSAAPETAAS